MVSKVLPLNINSSNLGCSYIHVKIKLIKYSNVYLHTLSWEQVLTGEREPRGGTGADWYECLAKSKKNQEKDEK